MEPCLVVSMWLHPTMSAWSLTSRSETVVGKPG